MLYCLELPTSNNNLHDVGISGGVPHDVLPVSIDSLKQSPLFRHLLHDIFTAKDRFQIQPLGLYFKPLVYSFQRVKEFLFPDLAQ